MHIHKRMSSDKPSGHVSEVRKQKIQCVITAYFQAIDEGTITPDVTIKQFVTLGSPGANAFNRCND